MVYNGPVGSDDPAFGERKNPLVGLVMHFTLTECWPVKPEPPLEGFFIGVLAALRARSMGLNRLRGTEDTQRGHPAFGFQPVSEGLE